MKSLRLNFGSSILFMAFLLGTAFLPGNTKANEPAKLTNPTKSISRGDSVLVEYPTRNLEDMVLLPPALGGMNISKYLQKNIHYPAAAVENGVEGQVKVFFRVDKNGNLTDIVPIESDHDILAAEVIKTLRNARVQPLIQNGIPVSFGMILPVTFELKH